jgi:glycosyltransferase involved in cell wall biosynthesis
MIQNIQHSSPPLISVIIPFHGDPHYLLMCVDSLQNQKFDHPFEIIIVESGNNDELKNIKFSENVIIKSFDALIYSGEARNIGAGTARAELFAFTDADCVVDRNWLNEIYLSYKEGNEIVVGPILNLYPYHPVASIDNLLQFVDFQNCRKKNVVYFPGGNFGITKSLFDKTKSFTGRSKNGEDVLFSVEAIKNSNGKVIFNPDMIIKHAGRKRLAELMQHHKTFGFFTGSLRLRLTKKKKKFNGTFLYAFLFGIKRLGYITLRTAQWNPPGLIRLIVYSPIFLTGLAAWVFGFWKGNKNFLAEDFNPSEKIA